MKRFLTCVAILFICSVAIAGYTGSQTLNPTTAVNDSSFGSRSWLGLPDKVQSDNGQAACPSSGLSYNQSMQLCKTGFSFNVPACAGDVTVTFRVKRRKTGLANIQDSAVRLVLAGTVQSEDFSQGANWPSSNAWAEYTFTSLTAAQVNDTGFGVAVSAKNVTAPGEESAPTGVPFIEVIEAVANW